MRAFGQGLLSLLHWRILLAMVGFAAVSAGIMYMTARKDGKPKAGSGCLAWLSAAAIRVVVQPLFLATVAETVIDRWPLNPGRALDHAGFLVAAGFVGWLFSLVLGLLPGIGSFFRLEAVGLVTASLPVSLAAMVPGTSFGTILSLSLTLLTDNHIFMLLLMAAAFLAQWSTALAATWAAKRVGEELPGEDRPPGPVYSITAGALQPVAAMFLIFSLMHGVILFLLG